MKEAYLALKRTRKEAQAAIRRREEAEKRIALIQDEKDKLENQTRTLEKQKTSALDSGDKKKLREINDDLELLDHQIEKKRAEIEAVQAAQGGPAPSVRDTERKFYSARMESYKYEIRDGVCKIPFSDLLRRAYALGVRCGVGDIPSFLFQWVPTHQLKTGEEVEAVINEIEAEEEGRKMSDLTNDEYEEALRHARGLLETEIPTGSHGERITDLEEFADALKEEADRLDATTVKDPFYSVQERLRNTAKELESMASVLHKPREKRTQAENLYPRMGVTE